MDKNLISRAIMSLAWLGVCFLPTHATAQDGPPGCHSVRFEMVFEPVEPPPTFEFEATFSGDIEGTADIVLLDGTDFTGITNTAVFHFVWTITGGKIAELIGSGFETIVDNRNIMNMSFDPENPFDEPIAYVVGKHRAEDGVLRANLSYVGEGTLTTDGRFETLMSHRGVICMP
jgi:hypothetical protein